MMARCFKKYNPNRGFTQLELVVVIVLISILGVIALNRMWAWRLQAERTMVKSVVGNIRSALGLETANLALHDKLHKLPSLSGSNPVVLLAQPPADYIGVYRDSNDKTKKPGIWYFNPLQKALIYTIRYTEGFKTSLKGLPRIRYAVKLIYSDKNRNGRYDTGIDSIAGLDLLPLDSFEWLDIEKE